MAEWQNMSVLIVIPFWNLFVLTADQAVWILTIERQELLSHCLFSSVSVSIPDISTHSEDEQTSSFSCLDIGSEFVFYVDTWVVDLF